MKLSPQLGLPALTIGLLLTASSVLAQSVHFNRVDDDHDGVLSESELTEALGSEALSASLLLDLDQNGDAVLSRNEVRAATAQDDKDDEYHEDGEVEGDEDGEGEGDVDDEGDEGEDDGDGDHGHGNSGGFDSDNPGRGHGDDGKPGGGRSGDNRGHGHDKND